VFLDGQRALRYAKDWDQIIECIVTRLVRPCCSRLLGAALRC